MIVQFPNLGKQGRLGNQLFQIASTIGIALRNGGTPRFPADWQYRQYFNVPDEFFGDMVPGIICRERFFEFDGTIISGVDHCYPFVSLCGYIQSHKYWQGYEAQIKQWLTPKVEVATFNTVAHIRRGDYVGNPNYYEIPLGYYLQAYADMYFSDDNSFLAFHGFPYNNYNEVEVIAAIAKAKHYVHLSNSTLAWWGAYLNENAIILRPDKYFAGPLAGYCLADFWPKNWVTARTDRKAILKCSFVIPVQYDHPDRLDNVKQVVNFLHSHFIGIDILIGECNGDYFKGIPDTHHVRYNTSHFHRTAMINDLTRRADYPICFNWDADVFCPPMQILKAVKYVRKYGGLCYPYDGTFYWMKRQELQHMVGGMQGLINRPFRRVGASITNPVSYGGAVCYSVPDFEYHGGENEAFVSYGPEDQERYWRFSTLGDVHRIAGPLFHIDHWRGKDSSERHEHGHHNAKLWQQMQRLNADQLHSLVNSEVWNKNLNLETLKQFI